MKIIRSIKKFIYRFKLFFEEKKNKDNVYYLFDNHHSNKLIIIFSGMSGTYNYRKTLKKVPYDQLYIKDTWANGVSYYLYEGGNNNLEIYTSRLIEDIISKKKYDNIICIGSSKGGASSLYFGLKHNVDVIYSGVGQYRLGDYLGIYHARKRPNYLIDVSGDGNREEWINILNNKMESMVESRRNSNTLIYLMYSKLEHTYPEHTCYLIEKLNECNIRHIDIEEYFTDHWACGDFFKALLIRTFYPKNNNK